MPPRVRSLDWAAQSLPQSILRLGLILTKASKGTTAANSAPRGADYGARLPCHSTSIPNPRHSSFNAVDTKQLCPEQTDGSSFGSGFGYPIRNAEPA